MTASRTETTWPRDVAILVLALLVTFVLPIAIYGLLSWKQFAYFRLTYFVPFEEIRAGLAEATAGGLYALPLIQMNMTSGHLLSNMYTLTLGQLVLSLSLGTMIGLGFLKKGPDRMGETLRMVDAARGVETLCEVVSPIFFDPDGGRVRG